MSFVGPVRLKLPATSANLGPGFDALGLAMGLYLTIDASAAEAFVIDASGRDAALCGRVEKNLILDTYASVLTRQGRVAGALHLRLENEIPLGMGCGSSAAALLAGVLLANHFGQLGWSGQQVLEEACRREGHPDNVAACWLGGMTASADVDGSIITATCGENLNWRIMVALPSESLATEKARALLPDSYSRADAVANVQSSSLLVAAFSLGRPELLKTAMRDRIHQPYRMNACPLLPRLLPLVDQSGVWGVSLSGAGPSVMLITDPAVQAVKVIDKVREAAGDASIEVLQTCISRGAKYL